MVIDKLQKKIKPRWETPLYKKMAVESHIIDKEIYYSLETCAAVLWINKDTAYIHVRKWNIKSYRFATKWDMYFIKWADILKIFEPKQVKK